MLPNSDMDSIPNFLDLDSDGDGITDLVEAGGTDTGTGSGTAGDGIIDGFVDGNGDGLDDDLVSTPLPVRNSDPDDLPDYIDPDSDNDTVPDAIEGHDSNANGVPDVLPLGTDSDNDGLDDGFDSTEGGTPATLPNRDSDSLASYRDPDDDNDGIGTALEDTNMNGNPTDDFTGGSNVPDYLNSSMFSTIATVTVCRTTPSVHRALRPQRAVAIPTVTEPPDWQDPDDDGDGIPTRSTKTSECRIKTRMETVLPTISTRMTMGMAS